MYSLGLKGNELTVDAFDTATDTPDDVGGTDDDTEFETGRAAADPNVDTVGVAVLPNEKPPLVVEEPNVKPPLAAGGTDEPNVKPPLDPTVGTAADAGADDDDGSSGAPNENPPDVIVDELPNVKPVDGTLGVTFAAVTAAVTDDDNDDDPSGFWFDTLVNTFDGATDSQATHFNALHTFTIRQRSHFQLTPSSALPVGATDHFIFDQLLTFTPSALTFSFESHPAGSSSVSANPSPNT